MDIINFLNVRSSFTLLYHVHDLAFWLVALINE